jgi:hypothetical protein
LLPFPRLRSDVGDVLYLNWLVPADSLEARLDEKLRVRRFGDRTVLSILVYRHGHFGPRLLGPRSGRNACLLELAGAAEELVRTSSSFLCADT